MKKRSWLTRKIQNWLLPEIIEQTNKEFARVREHYNDFTNLVKDNFERHQAIVGNEITSLKEGVEILANNAFIANESVGKQFESVQAKFELLEERLEKGSQLFEQLQKKTKRL